MGVGTGVTQRPLWKNRNASASPSARVDARRDGSRASSRVTGAPDRVVTAKVCRAPVAGLPCQGGVNAARYNVIHRVVSLGLNGTAAQPADVAEVGLAPALSVGCPAPCPLGGHA